MIQKRAVMANVRRRCVAEGSLVNYKNESITEESVMLYDVAKYIILPYTVNAKQPFFRAFPSTAGDQPPRWFASHWWVEPIVDFSDCIERLVIGFAPNKSFEDDRQGGGMTAKTPIWVCAYPQNQWGLIQINGAWAISMNGYSRKRVSIRAYFPRAIDPN